MNIVTIAKTFVGEKELPKNTGFVNPKLQAEMELDGWRKGEAWCCYLQEMLWEQAYPKFEKEFDYLFSGSCMQTWRNFVKEGYATSTLPRPGSVCIMQKYVDGKATESGHALLVTRLLDRTRWEGIEGNTNEAGSREGELVGEKIRALAKPLTGLRVVGFIWIRETLLITD
jgi:hypothetical protein